MSFVTSPVSPPDSALARLVARHGAGATFAALFRVLATRARVRRRLRADPTVFNPHLRRDIGLPPAATGWRHWDIR